MDKQILEVMMGSSPDEVWKHLLGYSWELFSNQINPEDAEIQIAERDRKIGELDTFLAGSAWDLWQDAKNSQFKTFYFELIEKQICLIDDYRIDLLALTPEERYKKLLENEPKLLNEVPLHYLASFLGISTRHMSRIRKNIK